jgi:hypothetical protein
LLLGNREMDGFEVRKIPGLGGDAVLREIGR